MAAMNILERYRSFAIQAIMFAHKLRILKTDCHNEAYGEFPIYPVIAEYGDCQFVEINEQTIKDALVKFPDMAIKLGDIRNLPFEDASFELVLDFSTIDHIPDYKKALDEYHRVLAPRGILSVVVWLDDHAWYQYQEAFDTHVWYAERDEFTKEFGARFDLLYYENYPWAVGGDGLLTRFVGRRRPKAP